MVEVATDEQAAAEQTLRDAYAAAAASTIAHTRAIADARRRLGSALTGDQPDVPRIPPKLAEADIAEIRAAELALGVKEFSPWTPEQTVQMIRRLPESLAAVLVAHWDEQMDRGWRCLELAHEPQLEQLRAAHLEAQQAHRCWDHTHEKVDLGG